MQLLGSGSILMEVLAAAQLLQDDFGVASDVWSAPSLNELRRDGLDTDRWNTLHPESEPRIPYVQSCLEGHAGPIVVATDYMKIVGSRFDPSCQSVVCWLWVRTVLGVPTRASLREFFEVGRHFIVVTALKALADEGSVPRSLVSDALQRYQINPEKTNPMKP